jgi:hypothetical protein
VQDSVIGVIFFLLKAEQPLIILPWTLQFNRRCLSGKLAVSGHCISSSNSHRNLLLLVVVTVETLTRSLQTCLWNTKTTTLGATRSLALSVLSSFGLLFLCVPHQLPPFLDRLSGGCESAPRILKERSIRKGGAHMESCPHHLVNNSGKANNRGSDISFFWEYAPGGHPQLTAIVDARPVGGV